MNKDVIKIMYALQRLGLHWIADQIRDSIHEQEPDVLRTREHRGDDWQIGIALRVLHSYMVELPIAFSHSRERVKTLLGVALHIEDSHDLGDDTIQAVLRFGKVLRQAWPGGSENYDKEFGRNK